jgi:type IV pilus assembly protein PilE
MSSGARPAAVGFTLIELMIALAVVAILLTISIPTYDGVVRKSRRAEGRELLMSIAHAQGRHYALQARYAISLTALGITSAVSQNGYYTVSLSPSATGYQLFAAPQAAQATDVCGTLVLNDLGQRDVQNASLTAAECWR